MNVRFKNYRIAVLVVTILFTATLLSSPSASALEVASQERVDVFLASRTMLLEERTPPKMKVGMVLSTLGEDAEISMGVRVEHDLGVEEYLKLITETTYLKSEQTIAGFLSLKVLPFGSDPVAVYLGAGAGYADGLRYQAFAGVDITKNMFAEIRYVNLPGGLGNGRLHLATGFQFIF